MIQRFVLPVLGIGVVAGSVLADGVPCALEPYLDQIDFISNPLADRDEARDIEIVDGIAYVAVDESGLQIIDVSDPSNMVLLSSLELGGEAQGVAVLKTATVTLVYVACGDAGVRIVNATDPSNPTFGFVSTIALLDAQDVALHSPGLGGQLTLSVAAGTEGYRAYNISTVFPSMIEFEFGSDTARAVEVQQIGSTEFIYVATASGIDVYSEGNSTTNNLLTTINTPGARDLDYLGDVIYVANGFDGIQVIELEADRTSGIIEDNLQLNFSTRKVTVKGDRLYVAENQNDVFVVDIADPTSPGVSGIIRTMGNGSCVGADGTDVFIGTQQGGVVSVDASDLAAFGKSAELGSFGWGDGNVSNVHRTMIEGSNAFVPRFTLEIFDVSTDTPMLASSFDTGNYIHAVDVVGTVAYAVDGSNLSIIDVSNPALPDLLGDFSASGVDVRVNDEKVYVAGGAGGMQVFDVSDPFGPAPLGVYAASSDVQKVLYVGDSVFGRVAHVFTEDSIDIVSLLDETTPAMLGPGITDPNKDLLNAVSDGDYVYQFIFSANTGRYMLQAVDVSNPLLPSVVSETSAVHYLDGVVGFGAPQMDLTDGVLSLTDGEAGVVMFDVTDPGNIQFDGVYYAAGGAMSWTTSGDRGYLRLGGEFHILDMSECAPSCLADLTGDGVLNFFDVSAFLGAFNSQDPLADFTGDGLFNFFDVSAFLSAFNSGCP